ncbi:cell division transport system permease protein [Cryobacterium mesophilum]|uniref:Cell division protein FtsX n=1 Tax=Terrimesophilobacter mesophilus TaxID=433647 RepID=A0A4V3I9S7_9MICO|nr:permease-like cell division protein FtsX [Terrimesophilobacter mesophilus]MBB5633920.1 cell division transport system permease protein [Terrimesophilobacter mesophilus]TFB80588.1 ABC transporter permease [Terrimesophilobacter mesophilus]
MRVGLVLSEVGQGLRRNVSMVVSIILVTFISLTFVGAAILLQQQINQMKGYWYDRAQVAVYLCTQYDEGGNCNSVEATPEQKANIEQQLKSAVLAPLIKRYDFEDHDAGYARYQQQFSSSESSGFVTPDFIPETFWVSLKDPSQSDAIVERLSGVAGVEEVFDQRKYLQPIFDALNAASYTAIGIAGLMLIAAVLLIATTIRLSAFSRRRELGIMRLVGASNRFIQTPFVLEGVVAALIGSVLASGAIVAIVHFFVQGYLNATPSATPFVDLGDAFIVVPILIMGGICLAALSAAVAIRRYLRV